MMFRPRESHDLRLLESRLEIEPKPASLRWLHDVFDNSVAIANFSGKTKELVFDSTVTLEHYEAPLPEYALAAEAESHPFTYPEDEWPDLAAALVQRYPSVEVERWASVFQAPSGQTDTMQLLQNMIRGIKEQFDYTRRVEKGVQSPTETLRQGRGSCRDFALLMMEAARSLGFAARFVSGYIFVPRDDTGTTLGGGATHAWLQVYLPGAGWVDFDPTNSIVGNRDLIRVAVAWDPKQVLPLWGTYTASTSSASTMRVDVRVDEVAS